LSLKRQAKKKEKQQKKEDPKGRFYQKKALMGPFWNNLRLISSF